MNDMSFVSKLLEKSSIQLTRMRKHSCDSSSMLKVPANQNFSPAAFPLHHLAHPNLRHRQQFFSFQNLFGFPNKSFVCSSTKKKFVKSYENVGTFTSHRVVCGSSASGDSHQHQIAAFHAKE